MKTQKILKPSNKIVIISDYREKLIIKLLKNFGVIVNKIRLDIGDFVVSERFVIERKTYSDFISSIIDGRLFEQVKQMKENFERPIIIVEGYSFREVNENSIKGAIASLLVDYGISILFTQNPSDTARIIYWIAKKEQEEKKYSLSYKVKKKSKELRRLQEEIVSSLPGISIVISRRLLEHFKSIEKIFTASETELRKIRGVGEKTAKRIRRILTESYR